MHINQYLVARAHLIKVGYGEEIEWSESISPPDNAQQFALEYVFVVCNSGMKAQIARSIYENIKDKLLKNQDPKSVFGHPGKVKAIWDVWKNKQAWFDRYKEAEDKLAFLETMPWIGCVTKYHLAKNFGVDVMKPDRHLVRVADHYGLTPKRLCDELSKQSGDRVATVDTVIWRCCNLGLFNLLLK